jgi:NAD dependent epimerase/dehydratase family enzyme
MDHDDAVGAILHLVMDGRAHGPVNLCAPHPVTNATFADVLGRVLERPTLVPVPKLMVKASLGEMGEEALLYSQRVRPARLLAQGYAFRYEGLEDSLRHQLGRAAPRHPEKR